MIAARPLTIGEIFDRGITLFVRNAPLVLLLLAMYEIPHALAGRYDPRTLLGLLVTLAVSPPQAVREVTAPLAHDALGRFATLFRITEEVLIKPLLVGALVQVLGCAYRGARPTFFETSKVVAKRGGSLLVVAAATFLAIVVASGLLVIVVALPSAVAALLAAWFGMWGSLQGVIVFGALRAFVALSVGALMFLGVVSTLAQCIVIFEGLGGLRSFATAWRRTLRDLPRSGLFAAAATSLVVTVIGAEIVGYYVIGEATRSLMFVLAVDAGIVILSGGLIEATLVVFYDDQRRRLAHLDTALGGRAPIETAAA